MFHSFTASMVNQVRDYQNQFGSHAIQYENCKKVSDILLLCISTSLAFLVHKCNNNHDLHLTLQPDFQIFQILTHFLYVAHALVKFLPIYTLNWTELTLFHLEFHLLLLWQAVGRPSLLNKSYQFLAALLDP